MSRNDIVKLANGQRVNCVLDINEGAPWFLMSNSHATNISLWDDLTAALRDRYQILRYDHRGHGASPASAPPYHINDLIEDVVALLDHFAIERTHFIGISMGGAIGMGMALHHSERLRSVIICDSSAGSVPDRSGDWDQRVNFAREHGVETLAGPTVSRWFAKASLAAGAPVIEAVRQMIRTTSLDGYIGCANALQSIDFSAGLEAITVPCLLIAGAEDGSRPVSMEQVHHRIPGSQYRVVPGAGHLSNIEQPEKFNAVVQEFLDDLAAAKAA
jgi:3-oxoadipate enol-lactonase